MKKKEYPFVNHIDFRVSELPFIRQNHSFCQIKCGVLSDKTYEVHKESTDILKACCSHVATWLQHRRFSYAVLIFFLGLQHEQGIWVLSSLLGGFGMFLCCNPSDWEAIYDFPLLSSRQENEVLHVEMPQKTVVRKIVKPGEILRFSRWHLH